MKVETPDEGGMTLGIQAASHSRFILSNQSVLHLVHAGL